ncbi:hypothetical protein [Streptomyces sp. NPDC088752]|uniref:hypothetical protein n=1 Tax=Streptomyces sp. NPDC088752 TaxID=3154963 RepID=UPI00341A1734
MTAKHRPTRLCPHRWCRPAHMLLVAVGLVAFTPVIFHSMIAFVGIALMCLVVYAITRAVRGRTITELSAEEAAAQHGNGRIPHLVVHTGWARAAIAMDFFYLAVVTLLAARVLHDPAGEADAAAAAYTTEFSLPSFLLGVACAVFLQHAHKKATDPVRPKRVLVPVRVES